MTRPGSNRQNIFVGSITTEVFLRDYWRRKPLFVKKGAHDILSAGFTEAEFDAILRRLRSEPSVRLRERAGDVVFVENLSRHLPELAQHADRFAASLGTPAAWFDVVRTYGDSGIGSHFDHSDNFVLQQAGVKRWALSPPRVISKANLARRMLQMSDIGSAPISEEYCQEFVLEPGDFLYLPLLWVHSGVSQGASLSLSLVCPAIPFQSLFLRSVQRLMLDYLLGYQPAPTMPPFLSSVERDIQAKALRDATRAVLRKLSSDEVIDAIVERQLTYLPPARKDPRPPPNKEC